MLTIDIISLLIEGEYSLFNDLDSSFNLDFVIFVLVFVTDNVLLFFVLWVNFFVLISSVLFFFVFFLVLLLTIKGVTLLILLIVVNLFVFLVFLRSHSEVSEFHLYPLGHLFPVRCIVLNLTFFVLLTLVSFVFFFYGF